MGPIADPVQGKERGGGSGSSIGGRTLWKNLLGPNLIKGSNSWKMFRAPKGERSLDPTLMTGFLLRKGDQWEGGGGGGK